MFQLFDIITCRARALGKRTKEARHSDPYIESLSQHMKKDIGWTGGISLDAAHRSMPLIVRQLCV